MIQRLASRCQTYMTNKTNMTYISQACDSGHREP